MSDALKFVRNASLVGLTVAFLVCAGGLVVYRAEITGAVQLRTAETRLMETLSREQPGAVFEIIDVTPRSAALVIGVHTTPSVEEAARLQDAVWVAYVDAFGTEGLAVSHVAVATVGDDGLLAYDRLETVDVATLAERTGRSAPALHAMYAAKEYFDPAVETPPDLGQPIR